MSRSSKAYRTLNFQSLEDRMLMAGNVTAAVKNGTLTITGDNNGDIVQISQGTSPNTIVLNGTLTNGVTISTTKINGKSTPQTFTVTGDVVVNFKSGDDLLAIGNTGLQGGGTQLFLPRNLTINMGDGDNSVEMSGATVGGNVSINAGSGTDFFLSYVSNIGSPNVNGGVNDFDMNLGGGKNQISMYYTSVEHSLNILDQASAGDVIEMVGGNVGTVGKSGSYLYIETGSGADQIRLDEMKIVGQLNIHTYGGNDLVMLGTSDPGFDTQPIGVVADSVYVDLGAGNDTLQLGGSDDNFHPTTGGGVRATQATYLGGAGVDALMNQTGGNLLGTFTGFESTTSHVIKK